MIAESMSLKKNYNDIKKARVFFKKFAIQNNINSNTIFSIEIAINEVIANIIEHGIISNRGSILFKISILNYTKLIMEFEYTGNYLTYELIEKHIYLKEVDRIEDLSAEGRGIFLIHSLMDKVTYDTGKNNLIKITLEKNINNNFEK